MHDDEDASAAARVRRAWRHVGALLGRVPRAHTQAPSRMPFGEASLDDVLGGLARGRISEIYGGAGSGKTTLALRAIATTQRRGGTCAIVDADCALHPGQFRNAGIDARALVCVRPTSGDEALQIVDELVRARACDLVVVDSVASLVPRAEQLGLVDSCGPAWHARLMSRAMRRLVPTTAEAGCALLFTNQLRRSWGDDGRGIDVGSGGLALPCAASLRLSLVRGGTGIHVTVDKERDGDPSVVGARLFVPLSRLTPPRDYAARPA